MDEKIFALSRGEGRHQVFTYVNVSSDEVAVTMSHACVDLMTGHHVSKHFILEPYAFRFMKYKP
ncbi:MAG: hypothetical protein IH571_04115 [Acholeplasmataceae bacterium]|nr:hypothetical protein [Acholeplasmataceae bacterium]